MMMSAPRNVCKSEQRANGRIRPQTSIHRGVSCAGASRAPRSAGGEQYSAQFFENGVLGDTNQSEHTSASPVRRVTRHLNLSCCVLMLLSVCVW